MRAPYKCHNPIPCCTMPCSRPEIIVTNNSDELIGNFIIYFIIYIY